VDPTQLEAMTEMGIVGGLTPLHVVVMHGWRCPGVLETLLQARADANTVAGMGMIRSYQVFSGIVRYKSRSIVLLVMMLTCFWHPPWALNI